MRPLQHTAASALCAAGTYALTRSIGLTAANFVAGILIDIDHVPEYLVKVGRTRPLLSIFKTQLHLVSTRTVLFFHGFDVITLLFFILHRAGFTALALALYIGAFQHLLLDTLYNPVRSPLSYFFFFRLRHGFKTEKILHPVDVESWKKG